MAERTPIVGVMGPGEGATEEDLERAEEIGCCIARNRWMLLAGGRAAGVMDAASKGAHEEGGVVIGVLLADSHEGMSPHVTIPIVTGMGSARNNINVLSSDALVAVGTGPGTASEIALGIKAKTPTIVLNDDAEAQAFFQKLGGTLVTIAQNVDDVEARLKELLG